MRKTPLLIDLDRMIFGSFVNFLEAQDNVNAIIQYVPFGSFTARQYPMAIPRASIHHHVVQETGIPGTETHVVVVCAGGPESIIRKILVDGNQEKVINLEKEIRSLRVQLATSAQEVAIARASPELAVARSKSMIDQAKKQSTDPASMAAAASRTGYRSMFDENSLN
jgi:hypothetical protein